MLPSIPLEFSALSPGIHDLVNLTILQKVERRLGRGLSVRDSKIGQHCDVNFVPHHMATEHGAIEPVIISLLHSTARDEEENCRFKLCMEVTKSF